MTNPKDDEWRALAAEHLNILQRIRLHEAENRRPHGESWPELFAALREMTEDWFPAMAKIMRMHGAPITSNQLFREMVRFQFVDEEVTLQKVRVRLSHGKTEGLWRRVKEPGALSGWILNEQEEAPTTKEAADAGADHPAGQGDPA